ncbi:YafY family transcriptional regulator [Tessaracoccus rhinocerotis]|uniref:YafY family transcriptional regulator n=1 Tax=Tessaracoccus rhinocerotis TaxID=1689449 RepID=A0A553K1Z0_9ACTN|nr:YafY family protein [Tessaracoccus rhinocerotis]TRY18709.1 YafY family transcriptional regulator [Tessaracoccus rhinocerotis]
MSNPSGRLLELLSLLQARRDWPGDALAQRLEVSPRTVRRDVERLRDLGYPVQTTKGPAGGYRLAPGLDLPPMLFDDDQAVAVAVALQTASTGLAGIQDAALRALATIRQVLPARLRHRVDALQVTALRHSGGAEEVDAEALLHIGAAIRDHETLRFDYAARDGGESMRRGEPYRMVARGSRWYALVWDLDRRDWRTFRVDRMGLRTNGPRFVPRELSDEEVAAHFGAEREQPSWPVTGKVLMHDSARAVSRWLPPHQGSVTPVDEGSCVVELGSWSHGAMVAWLLLFETDFEVIEPEGLNEALADVGARVARASQR